MRELSFDLRISNTTTTPAVSRTSCSCSLRSLCRSSSTRVTLSSMATLFGQRAQALAIIRVHSFYLHRGHVHLGTPAKHCGAKQYSHKTTANEQIHTHQYKLFLRLGTTFRHISDKRPFLRIKGQKPSNSYGESFTQRTGKASSALLVSQPSTYAKPADSGDPLLSGVQKSVNDPTK